MYSIPEIEVPFIMSGATARREINKFKKFVNLQRCDYQTRI